MITPLQALFCALEELRNRDDPIFDVLVALQARLTGSKPTRRCRCAASRRRNGFTCSARSASRTPRKERTSDEPGRLPPYREPCRYCPAKTQRCALSGRIPRNARAPVHLVSTAARVKTSRIRSDSFAPDFSGPPARRRMRGARSCTGDRPCGLPGGHDRDASDRFLPPNTLSTSTRTRPLPAHRHGSRHACTRWVAPIETEESSVSRRPKRFGGLSGSAAGVFFPSRVHVPPDDNRPLTPLSRASLASVAAPRSRWRWLRRTRQDRFHSAAVTRAELDPTRGAFPRQETRGAACPFQSTAHESSSKSRRCAPRPRRTASVHPRHPPSHLPVPRGFLF